MLTSLLIGCIDELKTIKEIEEISKDSKKQEKVDNSFKEVATRSDMIFSNLYLAHLRTGFTPSIEVKGVAGNILIEIEKVIKSGLAREGSNNFITNECEKIDIQISEEWKKFYSDKSDEVLSLLETVIDITPDKVKTQQAINKIKIGCLWPSDENSLYLLKAGLSEAEETIADLTLDEEIIVFLKKVGNKNATIADITTDILQWIETENLATKLTVNFIS